MDRARKRAFLRLSLQDASKSTPAFDMSDVVYTPSPGTPEVPDFQHVFLVNADFHHAVLPNADFTGAFLKRASFRYAQLPSASFQDAVLMQTDMEGAVRCSQRTARGFTMHHTDGWMSGWMGGGMWVWTVISVLVVVLLIVAITRLSKR